jgi:hypothetical protein
LVVFPTHLIADFNTGIVVNSALMTSQKNYADNRENQWTSCLFSPLSGLVISIESDGIFRYTVVVRCPKFFRAASGRHYLPDP